MSGTVTVTPPTAEPVSLAEAKAWLRVDGSEDDSMILGLIMAARMYVETFTRRALVTQTLDLALDSWPISPGIPSRWFSQARNGPQCSRIITLPRPPLVTVDSVKYYDGNGVLQTLSPSAYFVDNRAQPGRIVLSEDYDWPDLQNRPNAVVITYTVGYGAPAAVPQGLRTALRFMVTHWYENRTPVNIGNIVNEIPMSAEALLWNFRIPEAA